MVIFLQHSAIMQSSTSSSFKSVAEVDSYVQEVLGGGTTKQSLDQHHLINEYWVQVAKLYGSVGAHESALKFLEAYLDYQQQQQRDDDHVDDGDIQRHDFNEADYIEALFLTGQTNEHLGQLYAALTFYEELLEWVAATNGDTAPQHHQRRQFVDQARHRCIRLSVLLAEEEFQQREAMLAYEHLKRAVEMVLEVGITAADSIGDVCAVMAKHRPDAALTVATADDPDLAKSIARLLDLLETVCRKDEMSMSVPSVFVAALHALLQHRRYQSSWAIIVSSAFSLMDSLEWNEFVVDQLPTYQRHIPGEIDADDCFYFADNVARLALMNGRRAEASSRVAHFHRLLMEYLLPKTDISQSREACIHWSQTRSEYLARYYLYQGVVALREVSSGKAQSPPDQELVRSAYWAFLMSLDYVPDIPTNKIERIGVLMRMGTASRALLSMLCTYHHDWLLGSGGAQQMRWLDETSDFASSGAVLRPITYKDIQLNLAAYPKKLADAIKRMEALSVKVDSVVIETPWSLARMVAVAAWRLLDGSFRAFLRQMFPDLPDYPSIRSLQSKHSYEEDRTSSLWSRPSLTLADVEAFFVFMVIKYWRQAHERASADNATLGQTILSLNDYLIEPEAEHEQFWLTALYHHGSQIDPRRHAYASQVWSERKFQSAISELRGDYEYGENARAVYLQVALFYQLMLDDYGVDRSIEAIRYFQCAKESSGDATSATTAIHSQFFLNTIILTVLPEVDIDNEIEQVASVPNTRYQHFILDDSTMQSSFAEDAADNWINDTSHMGESILDQVSERMRDDIENVDERPVDGTPSKFGDLSMLSHTPARPVHRLSRQFAKLHELRSPGAAQPNTKSPPKPSSSSLMPSNHQLPTVHTTTKPAVTTTPSGGGNRLQRQFAQLKGLHHQ